MGLQRQWPSCHTLIDLYSLEVSFSSSSTYRREHLSFFLSSHLFPHERLTNVLPLSIATPSSVHFVTKCVKARKCIMRKRMNEDAISETSLKEETYSGVGFFKCFQCQTVSQYEKRKRTNGEITTSTSSYSISPLSHSRIERMTDLIIHACCHHTKFRKVKRFFVYSSLPASKEKMQLNTDPVMK